MASVSSLGTGSGLDLSGILTKLMTVEQQPLIALQKKEASYQARISALGSLKSSLSSLQTAAQTFIPSSTQTAADKFTSYKASVGDSTLASASVSSGATAGDYTLSNIVLAKTEQIRKSGFGIPATDGKLTIKVGSDSAVDVAVTGNSSLTDIKDAINKSTAGVTASIVNDGSTDYLVLNSKTSGAQNTISITGEAATGWGGFTYTPPTVSTPLTRPSGSATTYTNSGWTEQQAASNAWVNVNGLEVTNTSNTLTSTISGVSLTLTKETTSSTTLSVTKDTSSTLSSVLSGFVSAYNTAAKSIRDLGSYNAETKVAGTLQGEATLRTAQYQMGRLLNTALGGTSSYQTLSDLGVALQKDGTLKFDSSKLTAATSADPTAVSNLVVAVGKAFDSALEGLTGTKGAIQAATDSANKMISANTKQQAALSTRLTKIKDRYTKQFTNLDSVVASLNKTSSYLTQQLASLSSSKTSS